MYILSSGNNVLSDKTQYLLPTDYPASEASHNMLSFFIRFLRTTNASIDLTENNGFEGKTGIERQ